MKFSVFRALMTAGFCLLLLFLFLAPSRFLLRVSDRAEAYIADAERALRASDPETAAVACDALIKLYDDNALALERFLNHACVDAFGCALSVARAALSVGDGDAAIEALAEAKTVLARIRGIELFSPNSLL